MQDFVRNFIVKKELLTEFLQNIFLNIMVKCSTTLKCMIYHYFLRIVVISIIIICNSSQLRGVLCLFRFFSMWFSLGKYVRTTMISELCL